MIHNQDTQNGENGQRRWRGRGYLLVFGSPSKSLNISSGMRDGERTLKGQL